MSREEIHNAVLKELEKGEQHIDFTVEDRMRLGALWSLTVKPLNGSRGGLDESLEGATAWWPGPVGQSNGAADVLSVVPDEQLLNLRFASKEPPVVGGRVRVYPPQYLAALAEFWRDPRLGEASLQWLDRALRANTYEERWALPSNVVTPLIALRQRQVDALELSGWNMSFLWGPPGTGKTFTLGALVAGLLSYVPTTRILIVSTTNTAVDQVLISVDKALEQLERTQPNARTARRACFRLGNHFIASHYQGREHLLPVRDDSLVQRLIMLEASKPDASNVKGYAAWKEQVELIRVQIKAQAADVLRRARVAALTSARAVFTLEALRGAGPWDMIIFDEASQVGIPHAIAVAPVARRALFAGDPRQLAPVAQSQHRDVVTWLARSMFDFNSAGLKWACMLEEQSRMAAPICQLVSNVFYDGRLVVARDKATDAKWLSERALEAVEPLGADHVHVVDIATEAVWSQKYHGPIRYASAEEIVKLVQRLARMQAEQEILVLTPFRAQRSLVKAMLHRSGIQGVRVSTVHRAQGSECHTILFDPVDGSSDFLLSEEAKRLINVALSRAQARLAIFLSQGDHTNPILRMIASILKNRNEQSEALSISGFIGQKDFPACLLNQIVHIGGVTGRVVEILEHGSKFAVECFDTGKIKRFNTEAVVRMHSKSS